jgi:hypothetical protein
MAATFPDGYPTIEPAFSCPWEGCERRSNDSDEMDAHIRYHDFQMGYAPDAD